MVMNIFPRTPAELIVPLRLLARTSCSQVWLEPCALWVSPVELEDIKSKHSQMVYNGPNLESGGCGQSSGK